MLQHKREDTPSLPGLGWSCPCVSSWRPFSQWGDGTEGQHCLDFQGQGNCFPDFLYAFTPKQPLNTRLFWDVRQQNL